LQRGLPSRRAPQCRVHREDCMYQARGLWAIVAPNAVPLASSRTEGNSVGSLVIGCQQASQPNAQLRRVHDARSVPFPKPANSRPAQAARSSTCLLGQPTFFVSRTNFTDVPCIGPFDSGFAWTAAAVTGRPRRCLRWSRVRRDATARCNPQTRSWIVRETSQA